jgi:DNA-binding HxlR family transcriptional regulator
VRGTVEETIPSADEPWSPLILRDVWVGINRFDDIQRDLGISHKVLAERLKHLAGGGCSSASGHGRLITAS